MRTIKFRAWSTEQNKFIGTEMIYFKTDGTPNIRESTILMQFTGLKDKNGKEIYEGDIYITYDDYKDIYQVMYKKGAFVGGKNRKKCSPIGFEKSYSDENDFIKSNFHKESMTVIGNIYENPELLGNQSK